MRSLILLTFLVAIATPLAASVSGLPPNIASFLENPHNYVTEDGLVAPGANGSSDFVRYVGENWKAILGDFSEIAPDARRQHLITAAAESLAPSDYVDFLDGICDLKANGKVPGIDVDSIVDGSVQKEGFLAYNYDDPRVAAVVRKIEALAKAKRPNNADDVAYFAQLESGKMKQNLIAHRKEEGESLPEKLASRQTRAMQTTSSPAGLIRPSAAIEKPVTSESNAILPDASQAIPKGQHYWTLMLAGLAICLVATAVIAAWARRK